VKLLSAPHAAVATPSPFLPSARPQDEFWRKWNIPVHEWCLRHIFVDCQQYFGLNKSVAVLATFFFSAVAHE
jgi:D-alanyl-lipoteichoic acid acyltransferase DltB (MBOAT superfamily)